MIPLLGKVPLNSPLLAPTPPDAMTHPMAPKTSPPMGGDWQRGLTQLWGAVRSLLGVNQDAPLTATDIPYRWRSAMRISLPQSALAVLIPMLGVNDIGLLVDIQDYNHVLEWEGSKFTWGPGDLGSGWTTAFLFAPTAVGWHLLDGSLQVKYLKQDGSLGLVDLPTTPGIWFRQ